MRTDTPYNIKELFDDIETENCVYKAVSYHRNGTANKSQWLIDVFDEIVLFVNAITLEYIVGTRGWNVLVRNQQLVPIGVTVQGEPSYIGRFTSTGNGEWHGYPGDYKRSVSDIPHSKVLHKWVENAYITKAAMLRIQLQKPCNL